MYEKNDYFFGFEKEEGISNKKVSLSLKKWITPDDTSMSVPLDARLGIEINDANHVTITGCLDSGFETSDFEVLYKDIKQDIWGCSKRSPKIKTDYSKDCFKIEFHYSPANMVGSSIIDKYLRKLR